MRSGHICIKQFDIYIARTAFCLTSLFLVFNLFYVLYLLPLVTRIRNSLCFDNSGTSHLFVYFDSNTN